MDPHQPGTARSAMPRRPVIPGGENEAVRIDAVAYDHPDAAKLIAEVQQEYTARYGSHDSSPVDPAEFSPPGGVFLVGYVNGEAVACGGWRAAGADAEVKRMYVAQAARRTGLARAMLAELERSAQAAGHRRVILETGDRLPEALALYRSADYAPVAPFGYYADSPTSTYLGKRLDPGSR
jgi:GNAT superfamily N-acetyltransferase